MRRAICKIEEVRQRYIHILSEEWVSYFSGAPRGDVFILKFAIYSWPQRTHNICRAERGGDRDNTDVQQFSICSTISFSSRRTWKQTSFLNSVETWIPHFVCRENGKYIFGFSQISPSLNSSRRESSPNLKAIMLKEWTMQNNNRSLRDSVQRICKWNGGSTVK